jgi:lipopolysaccharide export system protein LptA
MKSRLIFLAVGLLGAAALRADDPPPVTITSAGKAETVTQGTVTTITFHDQVVVIDNGLRLTSDFLQVVVDSRGNNPGAPDQAASFKSMLATGNVHIYRGTDIATCGRAEISPNEDKIVLSEKPFLRRTDENASEDPGEHGTIIYYRGQQNAVVLPAPGEHNTVVLPAMKNLGLGIGDEPAAPAPPVPAK